MSVINLFLPKIIITSPDTVETVSKQILDVIANMRIGRIFLFVLSFSKKHMQNYAYIDLIMDDNEPAARFLKHLSERGFAKICDKTQCWKVYKHISRKHKYVDQLIDEVSCLEASMSDDEWEEPCEQYSYNDFVEQTAKMAYVLKENVVCGLSLMDLDLTDEILASMIGTSNQMIGTSNHMICEQSDSIHTYLNADLLMCL